MWSPWLVMLVYSRLLSCKRLRKLGSSPSSSSCTSPPSDLQLPGEWTRDQGTEQHELCPWHQEVMQSACCTWCSLSQTRVDMSFTAPASAQRLMSSCLLAHGYASPLGCIPQPR